MAQRGIDRMDLDQNAEEYNNFLDLPENLVEVININQKGCPLEAHNYFYLNALVVDGVPQIRCDVRVQLFFHEVHEDGSKRAIDEEGRRQPGTGEAGEA